MNSAWHARHPMPKNATLAQRVRWHRAHQQHCACRPVPRTLAQHLNAEPDPNVAKLIQAFKRDSRVTYGGKGFGSTALKLDGKIFAMLTPRGDFVVKLSAERVKELVAAGKGLHFQPAPGRIMKEWLTVIGKPTSWLALAREARSAVSAR